MYVQIPTKIMRCADFKFWLPKHVKGGLKALVVLTPGSNGDGRGMVDDKVWQEFAEKNKFGLVGCFFQDKQPTAIEGYARASEESGGALLWAIRAFSNHVEEVELEHIPLLLWGFSAGGQFNYEMNAAFPDRVGAFVVNKGGIYYPALCSERARRNPGLFFIGKKDAPWRQAIVKGLVQLNGIGGANWSLIEEDCGHGEKDSEAISQAWFEKVLRESLRA